MSAWIPVLIPLLLTIIGGFLLLGAWDARNDRRNQSGSEIVLFLGLLVTIPGVILFIIELTRLVHGG